MSSSPITDTFAAAFRRGETTPDVVFCQMAALERENDRLRELVDNARSTVQMALDMLKRVPAPEPDTARDPLG